jgi:hypothetical protein
LNLQHGVIKAEGWALNNWTMVSVVLWCGRSSKNLRESASPAASITSAAEAGIENRIVYRSGKPLRHPKAKDKSW